MKGKLLVAAAVGAAVLPFAVNEYFNSLCPELPKELILPSEAKAIPSFARQTGFSCSTCHTIPPRLNKYGMLFKMKGYTEGKALADIPAGDGYTITKFNPVSVRVLSYPYVKKKGEDREIEFPDEFMIAFAGRITENVGAVLEPIYEAEEGEWDIEYARIAAVKDFNGVLVGVIGGWTSPTGTDPFISLDYHGRRLTRQKATPHDALTNSGLQDVFDFNNRGASVYAYIANTLYVNVGAYTGTSRLENEDIGVEEELINRKGADPLDLYGRVAVTPPTGIADINVGAFVYSGRDKLQMPDGTPLDVYGTIYEKNKAQRLGLDLGVQKYLPNDFMAELLALFITGKDKLETASGTTEEVKHGGFNLSGTLYWKNKVGLSLVYGQYKYDDDNPLTETDEANLKRKDLTLHISYMVRPNVRLAAEYTKTDYSGDLEDTDISSVALDFAF